MGIEPTVPLPGQQFSRLPDSATLAPLRLVELAYFRVGLLRLCRRCDWLWGELTLGSVIFQSVFFSLEETVRIIRARLARLARKAGRVKWYWE